MPQAVFNNIEIIGISAVVPKIEKNLLDDNELYNGDIRKIERVVHSSGFLKRRVAEEDVMTSDLCFQAAKDLLKNTGITPEKIDALIFVSYTPDYLMPATAYVLHQRLELTENCIVMDIPQACSGYEIGLYQSASLLNAGCKYVLLLVGDCFSKFTDMFRDKTAPVFGDAGTATLLTRNVNTKQCFFNIFSDGSKYESLMCKNGGFKNPPMKENFYENGHFKYESVMHGKMIFDFTLENVSKGILDLLEFSGLHKEEIDFYIMHQANKVILKSIASQLAIDLRKMPMQTLTDFGNQCGASIPCVMVNELATELSTQENLLCLSGFGVGLSWANAIIHTNKIYCSGIVDYTGD